MKFRYFFILVLNLYLGSLGPTFGCKDGKDCEASKYGHRRTPLKSPHLDFHQPDSSPSSDENYAVIPAALAVDRGSPTLPTHLAFFKDLALNANEIRKVLIAQGVFRDATNVASFAFQFFDAQGVLIGDTYYFGNDSSEGRVSGGDVINLNNPFFFFSGYDEGKKVGTGKNKETVDRSNWTALSHTVPKGATYTALTEVAAMEPLSSSSEGTTKIREMIQNRIDALKGEATQLKGLVEEYLRLQADRQPFFEEIKTRSEKVKRLQDKNVVCSYFTTCITPEFSKVTGLAILKKGGEQHFAHSEQYALFKMKHNDGLRKFIDRCREDIEKTRRGPEIRHCAVLIYTTNTICARCAHSIFIDFFLDDGEPECLKNVISKALDLGNDDNPFSLSIMAACNQLYPTQELYHHDFFEKTLASCGRSRLRAWL